MQVLSRHMTCFAGIIPKKASVCGGKLGGCRGLPRLSQIFMDDLSQILTIPLKTLAEKYFQAHPEMAETSFRGSFGLRPTTKTAAAGRLRRRNRAAAVRLGGRTHFQGLPDRFPRPFRPPPPVCRAIPPSGRVLRRRTRNASRHERTRKHASRTGAPRRRARRCSSCGGTSSPARPRGRATDRSRAWSSRRQASHAALRPWCGALRRAAFSCSFVSRSAFVFRARTDPEDAATRRRDGEDRLGSTPREEEVKAPGAVFSRSRRRIAAAAEPRVRARIFVVRPEGPGLCGR